MFEFGAENVKIKMVVRAVRVQYWSLVRIGLHDSRSDRGFYG